MFVKLEADQRHVLSFRTKYAHTHMQKRKDVCTYHTITLVLNSSTLDSEFASVVNYYESMSIGNVLSTCRSVCVL